MKQTDPVGRAIHDLVKWYSSDGPNEAETEVSWIVDAYAEFPAFADTPWLEVVRVLDKAGAGKLILGRHGHPTRFAWLHGSSRHVASGVWNYPKPPDPIERDRDATDKVVWRRLSVGKIECFIPTDVTKAEITGLIVLLQKEAKGV